MITPMVSAAGAISGYALRRGTGKSLSMSNVDSYSAFPNSSATEVEFLYQQELTRSVVEKTKKIEDSSVQSLSLPRRFSSINLCPQKASMSIS